MSRIDALIRRLAGSEGQERLSPAEERALRLAVHDGAAETGTRSHDAAAEHLRLAAYLDGSMTAQEQAAFEQELARSPAGREQLISAAAWLDELDAKRQSAPDHLVRQALALHPAESGRTAEAWWQQWLPAARRPWMLAAAALATVAIVIVAIQAVRQLTSRPSPGSSEVARVEPRETRPAALKRKLDASPDLVVAVLAYDRNPGAEQRKDLLARLQGPGMLGVDPDRVQTIEIEKALRDRLQAGTPPAAISLSAPSPDRLVLGMAD